GPSERCSPAAGRAGRLAGPLIKKLLLPLFLLVGFVSARAEGPGILPTNPDEKVIAAVRAADDERRAAILAADRSRLDAIFSDALTYTHSSGKIDSKASY